jgi:hypothetical protein
VINHQLERLATQLPADIRKFSKQSAVTTNYFRIRDLANNLHGVFRKRFQDSGLCPCNASHNANLQLPRIRSDTIDKSEDASKPVRFQVLFSFDIISPKGRSAPWNWRGLEFEPLSELLPEPLSEPLSELLPEPTTQGIPQAIYPAEIKPSEEARRTSRRIWNRIASFRTKSHKGKPAHLVSSPSSSAAISPKV